MKKRLLFFVMMVVVLVMSSGAAEISVTNESADILEESVTKLLDLHKPDEREGKANQMYQKFMIMVCPKGEYNDNYAGAYIDEEYKIHIFVTDESDATINDYCKKCGLEDYEILKAEYSLKRLKSIQKCLSEKYEELYQIYNNGSDGKIQSTERLQRGKELLLNLRGFYIDEKKNRLVVEISGLTDTNTLDFEELFGKYSEIIYEEGNNFSVTTSEWRPGRRIYNSSSRTLSTGYRCYYLDSVGNRYNGFATAGHGVSTWEDVYRSAGGSNKLGTCKTSQFSGSNDVAFVHITDSEYVASNIMYYSDENGAFGGVVIQASEYVTYAAQGTKIYKVGATSFLTEGTVQSSSCSKTLDGVTINDLLKTDALNLSGDSGGCAYILHEGRYVAAGTMSGSTYTGTSLTPSSFSYSYVSQIANARYNLGIIKY